MTTPLLVPAGGQSVRFEPPAPLVPLAAARSVIPPPVGVEVGVGVVVAVGVGVPVDRESGVWGKRVDLGWRRIIKKKLELAPPLCVPWIVPVAPIAANTSCDISEVV